MVGWLVGWLDSWINGLGWTAWPGCRRLARLNRWLFGKGAKRNAKCQSQAQNRDQKPSNYDRKLIRQREAYTNWVHEKGVKRGGSGGTDRTKGVNGISVT